MPTAPLSADDPVRLQAARDRVRNQGLNGHREWSVVASTRRLVGDPGLGSRAPACPVSDCPGGVLYPAGGMHVADRLTFQVKSLLQCLGVFASDPIGSRRGGVLDLDCAVWALDAGLPTSVRQ